MLVLAMEFSRDARHLDSETKMEAGRSNTRAADRQNYDDRHRDGSDRCHSLKTE